MAWSEWHKRSAYLLVQADGPAREAVWKKTQKWTDAIGSWLVTGSWDLLVWVDAHSWEDLYDRVVELRSQKGVRATSTHFVYKGLKNGKWWWDWNAGSWVWLRAPKLNGEMKRMTKWPWMTSAASVPGDWDYLVWAGGSSWDKVWSNVWSLNKAGWHTETLVPIKSWWNKSWKRAWWGERAAA